MAETSATGHPSRIRTLPTRFRDDQEVDRDTGATSHASTSAPTNQNAGRKAAWGGTSSKDVMTALASGAAEAEVTDDDEDYQPPGQTTRAATVEHPGAAARHNSTHNSTGANKSSATTAKKLPGPTGPTANPSVVLAPVQDRRLSVALSKPASTTKPAARAAGHRDARLVSDAAEHLGHEDEDDVVVVAGSIGQDSVGSVSVAAVFVAFILFF
jgi:hypothetical protein